MKTYRNLALNRNDICDMECEILSEHYDPISNRHKVMFRFIDGDNRVGSYISSCIRSVRSYITTCMEVKIENQDV